MATSFDPTAIRAVLFDLDGTLYHQERVRRRMAVELARSAIGSPLRTPKLVARLKLFRELREELRELGQADEPLDELQYRVPAERGGFSADQLRADVNEWMMRRPLPFVARAVRREVPIVLRRLESSGRRIGVFSDYPVQEKLEALGCHRAISLQLAATDPEINAFKPHPRGFLQACERWGLSAEHVLFVGDRQDVDAGGAERAGMPHAIVGSPQGATDTRGGGDALHRGTYADLTLLMQHVLDIRPVPRPA